MPFRVAVDALGAGQVRAGVAGVASAAFQGGHLFRLPREAFERPLRDLDCVQRIDPNCLQAVWNSDVRDANLDTRKDPSGNP